MTYQSLKECIDDLERQGHLIRIKQEVDPNLEMAEIQRRVFAALGPAIYYERVKGSPFPAVSNLFGTMERARFIFRHTLDRVKRIVDAKVDPGHVLKSPWRYPRLLTTLLKARPKQVSHGPSLSHRTTIDQLPQIKSWPDDGGAFMTLPQVLTLDQDDPKIATSNLGMYRIQISGGKYKTNEEIGLHYQIHRGIGVHHSIAIKRGEPLRVSIFVGGPPSHTLAAVMPLPEGLSELLFAGVLGNRRFRYVMNNGHPISADADFCITGTIIPNKTLPEGPFGDHLGYYSLTHDYPVMKVDSVYHRENAIWPFTVVGRPPQEDTIFGQLIHELTSPLVPKEIPGVRAIHAVDAAGVHPLMLAVGSERYVPYQPRKPREILIQANAILGFGQCSLTKYLFIAADEDHPQLDVNDIPSFFTHVLERADWENDVHLQTRTTIDTLDYTGCGLHRGSKAIIAVAGEKRRDLSKQIPSDLSLPNGFKKPQIILPGILAIESPPCQTRDGGQKQLRDFCQYFDNKDILDGFPLIILADDSDFTSSHLNNFLWVTFTRSNPAHDMDGIRSLTINKHWGCKGSLVIDARTKPQHAPALVEDMEITKRVDALGEAGRCLHGVL